MVAVDLVASGVAYKERLNLPVVAEVVAREQPEHLREYFMERVRTTACSVHSCRTQTIRGIQKWPKQ
ncbi:DNA polymerase III subunit theta [Escherichia coli]|nr:DNA polymerase III subunit theta [Escherichia coli]